MAITINLIIILIFLLIYNVYYILKEKWLNVFYMIFLLLLFIPTSAIKLFSGVSYDSGGYINISLVGYDTIIIAIISVLLKKKFNNRLKKKTIIKILLFFSILICVRLIVNGVDTISNKIIDNYVFPIILAILLSVYLKEEEIPKILNFIFICILINAVIAGIEYFVGRSLFFHEFYLTNVKWYGYANAIANRLHFRTTAFLGHSLVGGLYYLIGLGYLIYSKKKIDCKYYIEMIILLFAIFSTNSRAALMISIIIIMYNFIICKKYIQIVLTIFFCIFIINFMDFKFVYNEIFARDVDGGSILTRINALKLFIKIDLSTLLLGAGFNNVGEIVSKYNGSVYNLEISYFIIIIENGIIVCLMNLCVFLDFIKTKVNDSVKVVQILKRILKIILINCCFFSSIGDPGTIGYMLWAIAGMIAINNNKSIEYRK